MMKSSTHVLSGSLEAQVYESADLAHWPWPFPFIVDQALDCSLEHSDL